MHVDLRRRDSPIPSLAPVSPVDAAPSGGDGVVEVGEDAAEVDNGCGEGDEVEEGFLDGKDDGGGWSAGVAAAAAAGGEDSDEDGRPGVGG